MIFNSGFTLPTQGYIDGLESATMSFEEFLISAYICNIKLIASVGVYILKPSITFPLVTLKEVLGSLES